MQIQKCNLTLSSLTKWCNTKVHSLTLPAPLHLENFLPPSGIVLAPRFPCHFQNMATRFRANYTTFDPWHVLPVRRATVTRLRRQHVWGVPCSDEGGRGLGNQVVEFDDLQIPKYIPRLPLPASMLSVLTWIIIDDGLKLKFLTKLSRSHLPSSCWSSNISTITKSSPVLMMWKCFSSSLCRFL